MSVSVVIPAYNAEPFLKETVQSVLDQDGNHLDQIWIVDDGSSDKTKAIGEILAEKHKKVSFLTQKNQGPSAARNLGLERVTSRWVAFLDADDLWKSNFLETALSHLASAGAHTFIAQAERFRNTPGDLKERFGPRKSYRDNMPQSLLFSIPFAPCMGLVATEFAKKINGFRGGDVYWEDWDFWIRIGEEKAKFAMHEGEPIAYYRHVDGSRSSGAVRCFKKSIETLNLHWDSPLASTCVKKRGKARFLRWISKNSPTYPQRLSAISSALRIAPFEPKSWFIFFKVLLGSYSS